VNTAAHLPDFLTHYYEAAEGPFRSLTTLPPHEAETILERIRRQEDRFAARRAPDYLTIRYDLEQQIRALFIEHKGCPRRDHPHYFILGECPWLKSWYNHGCEVRIPINAFSPNAVSFTYGDSFPAMRYKDGKPYRGQVYTLAQLPEIVQTYGLPQIWNSDGHGGPERYIEAQVWEEIPGHPALSYPSTR
jgi:hypothetical protein